MASLTEQENSKSQENYDCILENNEHINDHTPGERILNSSCWPVCSNVSSTSDDEEVDSRQVIHSTRRTRSFPPPLPCLAKSHSQFPLGMPLAQLHSFRSKGRFVLQEIKVPPPVMFQPIRRDGRFVLQLIRQEDAYPEHDTDQNVTETAPSKMSPNAANVAEEYKEFAEEKYKLLSEVPNAFAVIHSQCPCTESSERKGLQTPRPDSDDVTPEESGTKNTEPAAGKEVSEQEDASTAEQVSPKRITVKPTFEGRCYPKERGVDWHLAKLHITSVSM